MRRPRRSGRVVDHAGRRLLRRRDRRWGPAGVRCSRVRGIRGSAHGAGRTAGHRWTGRPDPRIENYLGFPDGVSGRAAHRSGAPAGARVRRRDPERPATSSASMSARSSAEQCGSRTAAKSLRTPCCSPPASRTGSWVFPAPTSSPAAASSTGRRPRRRRVRGRRRLHRRGAIPRARPRSSWSRHTRRVTLLVRADDLARSMSHYLVRQLEDIPNVEVRLNTEVLAVHGDDHLEALTLCNTMRAPRDRARRIRLRVHRCGASHRLARGHP